MSCRRNYRDLTQAEKDRFVQALYHLKSVGLIDQFANEHGGFFFAGIHGTSHFLPWHRDFLRRFEDALRTFHPDVSIPYWNSTEDQDPNDPLWDNDFLGQFDAAWGLNRALGAANLPSPQDAQNTLALGTYDQFWPTLESVLHNSPHNWVSGVMASVDSPGDPAFYLHHCWIDLLWAQWQVLNPGAAFVSSGAGFDLNDPMTSVATTPAEVLDHRDIGMYEYPPGFQEDLPAVTLDTPSVSFIEVPEGETRLAAAVFSIEGCEPVHLSVVNGPTVTSGPPETVFAVMATLVSADPEIDSKGRVWITYTGTSDGDIATGTVTVRCDETGEEFIVSLSANTIARPSAAIVMVLDQSNSMNFEAGIGPGIEREDVLKFSAPTAVVVLDEANAMAVCSFDHDAHPGIGMTAAAGVGKITINGAIAAYSPNPNGWTSIGEGVALAHDILDPVTGYDVKAMVVLTDGAENHGPHTRRYIADVADQITSLNGRVFAIGLGRPEVLNPTALMELCSGNSGYMAMTGDLTPDASFRLAKYYQQIFAGVTNNEIVLDPEGYLALQEKRRIPFWLNEADISAKAVLLTPAPQVIRFVLETPDGETIDPGVAGAHPSAAFEIGDQVSLYRVSLPIPLGATEAHAGRWYARLSIEERNFKRYLASIERNPKLYKFVLSHGIAYSFNVQAYSNLRMEGRVVQSSNEPGGIITVRARLTEYGVPVTGRARCRIELTRADQSTASLTMSEIDPGIFQVAVVAAIPGTYVFRILAEGRTFRGRRFTREQTLTGAVWKGGDNPPPSGKDDPNGKDDRWCRLVACLIRQPSIQEALRKLGVDREEFLKCLQEYCEKRPPDRPPNCECSGFENRLRSIVGDDGLVRAVMAEIERNRN
jgi:hypothetical protein